MPWTLDDNPEHAGLKGGLRKVRKIYPPFLLIGDRFAQLDNRILRVRRLDGRRCRHRRRSGFLGSKKIIEHNNIVNVMKYDDG